VLAVEEPTRTGKGAEPRILLERQYRHAAQSMMWELPAGRIDDGETAITAAKRELLGNRIPCPPVEENSPFLREPWIS